MAQCTAQSKQTGKQCRRAATVGRTVCKMHGGKSLAGPASGAWKHGGFSTAYPTRIHERAERAMKDPELLSLNRVIAVYDARLEDLGQRIDTGESGELWKALRKAQRAWKAATCKGDKEAADEANEFIMTAIEAGANDNAAWQDSYKVFELRRVAVQTEARRRKELNETITAEQAYALMEVWKEAIRKHVTDRATLSAIGAEFGRIARGGNDKALPS